MEITMHLMLGLMHVVMNGNRLVIPLDWLAV